MTGIHYLDAKGPPGMRLFAIGDVHGRLDLLEAMFARIEAQLDANRVGDWRIILLGDYVDRGPDSRGVIDLIQKRASADPRVIALCGNHDAGMLAFLDDPLGRDAYLFTHHGGRETAMSYGVKADFSSNWLAQSAQIELLRALPARHIDFLRGLPRSVSFGDFFFCHAGIRPGVELAAQDPDVLIWIRDDFLDHAGLHPKIIVHGHTPNYEPEVLPNRINVDTKAYESGVLTALVIDGAQKEFLTEVGASG